MVEDNNGLKAVIVGPLIASWVTSFITGNVNIKKSEKSWFQPPGYVFFAVWTALYIMFGFLLYESFYREDYLNVGLIIGLCCLTYSWKFSFSYFKHYKLSMFILFLSLVLGLILLVQLFFSDIVTESEFSKGWIMVYVPFIAWILFAMMLSATSNFKIKIKDKIKA